MRLININLHLLYFISYLSFVRLFPPGGVACGFSNLSDAEKPQDTGDPVRMANDTYSETEGVLSYVL